MLMDPLVSALNGSQTLVSQVSTITRSLVAGLDIYWGGMGGGGGGVGAGFCMLKKPVSTFIWKRERETGAEIPDLVILEQLEVQKSILCDVYSVFF